MSKIKKIVKKYIRESIDSLITDQISSAVFGLLCSWIIGNSIHIVDNENVSTFYKFLILGIIFFIFYLISTIMKLRPNRYKFKIKSLDIIVEYLGDEVNVYSKYVISTNRFRTNRMYLRQDLFSDEKFEFKTITNGYRLKKIKKMGNRYEYYLIFPKYLYFGKTGMFETKLHALNKNRRFENFYWYDVICPTEKITIDVRIPQQYCTKKVELRSFLEHENSLHNEKKVVDYNGSYRWEIDNPKLGWSYKFGWNWSRNELNLHRKMNKK